MIDGLLLLGGFRTFADLLTMSRDDRRNTLIVELTNRTNQPVTRYQAMDDALLAGTGATLLFLRASQARTDEQLRTLSDDDQRNLMIIALNAQTAIPVPTLQAKSNVELVRLGLMQDGSSIRGVLLLGGFRSFAELNSMSPDDRRNTLIVELSNRTNQPVTHFQSMTDSEVAGSGAALVTLRLIRARSDDELATISDDDQRNLLIIAVADKTGHRVSELQSLSNLELVLEAAGLTPLEDKRLIADHYEQDGRSAGLLGIPMANVRLTTDGATQPFSGGFATVRSGKLDVAETFQAEVRFLGFRCNDESDHDQLSSSDEPYFIISITGLKNNVTKLFGRYEDVDGGESRFTTAGEDILVSDVQPPFTLSVIAKEWDEGTPSEASDRVKKSMEDAIRVTQALAVTFGQAQVAAVTVMLNTVFTSIGGFVSDAVSDVLGLDDDLIGTGEIRIGDWNDGQEEWRTPARLIEEPSFSPSPYNVKVDVGDDGEGRYSLYFNVNMFKISKEHIPALPS